MERCGNVSAAWHREKERHLASGLHQSLARRRHARPRRDYGSEPGAPAAHPDDHAFHHRRADPGGHRHRCGFGAARLDCCDHNRRANTLFAAGLAGRARGVFVPGGVRGCTVGRMGCTAPWPRAQLRASLRQRLSGSGLWLRWMQAVAVPACAALLLLVGYQNIVSIPHWKGLAVHSAPLAVQAVQVAAPNGLPIFSLLGSNRRGGARPVFQAKAGESFALRVEITDTNPSAPSGYLLRLDDGSGTARVLTTVSREEAKNTVFVEVPAGFPAGNAHLVVLGVPQPGAGARSPRRRHCRSHCGPQRHVFSPEFGSLYLGAARFFHHGGGRQSWPDAWRPGFQSLDSQLCLRPDTPCRGLPSGVLALRRGGNEGTHTIANVNTSLLGGSGRPSLF